MAKHGEVKLIGAHLSPYVLRVEVALNLKRAKYEFLSDNLKDKSELLLKSNPVYKKVPVLIHNGKSICESMIIVEYVDAVWRAIGTDILPEDPYELAVQRFWVAYIDDKLISGMIGLKARGEEANAEAMEKIFSSLKLLEEAFETCSKGKDFFNGDTIGYLDIALGGYIGWLKGLEKLAGIKFFDESKFPLLSRWEERFCSHEDVKEVMHDADKVFEYVKMIMAKA